MPPLLDTGATMSCDAGPSDLGDDAAAASCATALAPFLDRVPGSLPFRPSVPVAGVGLGLPTHETRAGLARRWRVKGFVVKHLVALRVLPEVPSGTAWPRTLLDTSRWSTPAEFFRDWEAQLPMLDSYADFDVYDAVRRLCGLAGTFTRFALDCMFNFLGEMESWGDAEIRALTTILADGQQSARSPGALTKSELLKALRETSGRRAREDRVLDEGGPATVAMLRESLPEALRHLPRTILDRDFGEDYLTLPGRAPDGADGDDDDLGDGISKERGDEVSLVLSESIIRRLLAVRSTPVRLVATVWMLIHRAQHPFGDPWRYIAFAETVDDLFEGLDASDPEVAAERLWAYIGERSLQVCDAPWAVLGVALFWRGHRTVLEAYAANNSEVSDAVLSLLLPLPQERLVQAIRGMRAGEEEGERRRRREHVRPLARTLPAKLAAMRNRARQARRMQRECERATRKRIELAEVGPDGLPPPFAFSYVEDVIGADGLRRPGRQTVYMVAWPDESVLAALAAKRSRNRIGRRSGDVIVDLYEFVGVEADCGDVDAVEPWFVEMFRVGALGSASYLDADVRERRRRLIIDQGLPNQQYRPGGLCASGSDREWRILLLSLAHLGRVLIPVQAFAHGMVMACVLGGIAAKSLARLGEIMQLRKEEDGWKFKLVRGRWRVGFWAVPKNRTARRAFRVDDRILRELRWLKLLALARDGLDDVEVVAPSRRLRRKCGPSRYVFAFRGRALPEYSLHFLLRVLCAGLGRCLPHDLRHAGARFARRNGGTRKGVGMRLDHAEGSELTEWYSGMLDELEDWDDEDGDAPEGDDNAGEEDADAHFADLDRDGIMAGELEDEEEYA